MSAAAPVTLLVLAQAGVGFDLGFDAAQVRRVIDARDVGADAAPGGVLDLFALVRGSAGAPASASARAGRIVVAALDGGGELWLCAPGSIAVVTPRELLRLPRIVTRRAPFIDAVVLEGLVAGADTVAAPAVAAPAVAAAAAAAPPLFVIALERIPLAAAAARPLSKPAELW